MADKAKTKTFPYFFRAIIAKDGQIKVREGGIQATYPEDARTAVYDMAADEWNAPVQGVYIYDVLPGGELGGCVYPILEGVEDKEINKRTPAYPEPKKIEYISKKDAQEIPKPHEYGTQVGVHVTAPPLKLD